MTYSIGSVYRMVCSLIGCFIIHTYTIDLRDLASEVMASDDLYVGILNVSFTKMTSVLQRPKVCRLRKLGLIPSSGRI